MATKRSFMTCVSLTALLWGGAAAAQTASAPAAGGMTTIEEVIVTAQHRAQAAQDVPITITAFSADQIEKAGIQSMPELSRVTPGLQFQAVGASSVPFLRGVGAATTTAGAESTVAIIVDGVYIAAQPAGSLMSLPNISSVEVDRGPQGTLFGRNATGGVIQITTRRPGQTPTLDLSAGYGNYDTFEGSFYGSTPLTSNLAADLSISANNQGQGFGKNLFDGSDIYKGYDYSLRSKWVWQATEKTDVTFIANYEQLRSQTGFATRLPAKGELGLDQRGNGGFQYVGGFYDVNLNYPSFNETRSAGASVDIQHDLGFAKLRSITAYSQVHWVGQVDFDLSPNTGSHQRAQTVEKTTSEEIQLLSPDSSERFNWALGAYLYANNAAYTPFLIQYPAGAFLSTTRIYGKQDTTSWALFGQGTYEVFTGTRFTAGLRYTEDTRDFTATQTSEGLRPGFLFQKASKTFPKLTYHFALDHRFGENLLGFAQVTRGFKSGLYNTLSLQPSNSSIPTVVNPETLDSYEIGMKSDWMNRRLRVNLSGFYYDYQNQQVNAFVGSTRILFNAAASHIKGIDAEIVAVPIDNLTVSLNAEYLDAKYQDFPGAPLFTPVPAPGVANLATPINAAGKHDPYSPKFTSTLTVDYEIPTEFGKATVSGSWNHNSGYYFDFGNLRKQSAYNYLSGTAKFEFGEGRWDITLWGKNLLDEKVYASVNQVAQGPTGLFGGDSLTPRPPRTFGVRFGAHF